jgi:hypothetical protein
MPSRWRRKPNNRLQKTEKRAAAACLCALFN